MLELRVGTRWFALLATVALLAVGMEAQCQTPAAPASGTSQTSMLPPGVRYGWGPTRFHHGRLVESVAFSPDGKWLVSASFADRSISIWDAQEGREASRIRDLPGVRRIAISPDGQVLAATFSDGPIRRWTIPHGQELPSLGDAKTKAEYLAFHPRERLLASVASGWSVPIQLWSLDTGELIPRFPVVREPIFSFRFSPDGRWLATARDGASLRIWDVATGQVKQQLTDPATWVFGLDFSPDSKWLATSDSAGKVRLWEVESGTLSRVMDGLGGSVSRMVWLPDGKQLVCAVDDGGVRVCDVAEKGAVRRIPVGLPNVTLQAFAVSPDGRTLVTTSAMRFFDLATGDERWPREYYDGPLAWSPDERWLLSGSGPLRLMDLADGAIVRQWSIGDTSGILASSFADAGRSVRCVTTRGSVWRWDRATGELLGRDEVLAGNVARFSSDGERLVIGASNGMVQVCSWGGEQVSRLSHLGPSAIAGRPTGQLVGPLAWAPRADEVFVALGAGRRASRGELRTWNATTGKPVREWMVSNDVNARPPTAVAYSPDGHWLAAACEDFSVRLWEVATGLECEVAVFPQRVESLAFSPDGTTLALGSGRTISLASTYDPARELRRYDGHRDLVQQLAFSPSGDFLASGSRDGVTLVWEIPTSDGPPLLGASREQLELWANELGSASGRVAFAAQRQLAAAGPGAMPILRDALHPRSSPAEPGELERWIDELASDQFQVREAAHARLRETGRWATRSLEAAADSERSFEARQRAKRLLELIARDPLPESELRALRAVRIVERLPGREALDGLQAAAAGDPALLSSQAARQALLRRGATVAP